MHRRWNVKRYQWLSGKGGAVAVLTVLLGLSGVGLAGAGDRHPELEPGEMYISCSDCHREATPEVYSQWYDSLHGLAMVKCYQCHGTFETFRLTPEKSTCASCHEKMVEKCPKNKDCWQCHVPHTFKQGK